MNRHLSMSLIFIAALVWCVVIYGWTMTPAENLTPNLFGDEGMMAFATVVGENKERLLEIYDLPNLAMPTEDSLGEIWVYLQTQDPMNPEFLIVCTHSFWVIGDHVEYGWWSGECAVTKEGTDGIEGFQREAERSSNTLPALLI